MAEPGKKIIYQTGCGSSGLGCASNMIVEVKTPIASTGRSCYFKMGSQTIPSGSSANLNTIYHPSSTNMWSGIL